MSAGAGGGVRPMGRRGVRDEVRPGWLRAGDAAGRGAGRGRGRAVGDAAGPWLPCTAHLVATGPARPAGAGAGLPGRHAGAVADQRGARGPAQRAGIGGGGRAGRHPAARDGQHPRRHGRADGPGWPGRAGRHGWRPGHGGGRPAGGRGRAQRQPLHHRGQAIRRRLRPAVPHHVAVHRGRDRHRRRHDRPLGHRRGTAARGGAGPVLAGRGAGRSGWLRRQLPAVQLGDLPGRRDPGRRGTQPDPRLRLHRRDRVPG